ncbi:hypothetical protein OQA88_9708 [Cercophora sp. LCS_1]
MFRRKSTRQPPQKQQDPFQRINAWDDGYEYIRDKPSPPPAGYSAPFYSPPMTSRNPYEAVEPPRSRRHDDTYTTKQRGAYPSPPSSSDQQRRHRRRSPSPQPYRTRSPSPPRRRDYYEREPLSRSKSMREPPRQHQRNRSPSPILPGGRLHHRDRDREHRSRRAYSPSPSPSPTRHRRRSPSPIRRQKTKELRPEHDARGPTRPNLSRSKTTSAKDRFQGLSPRWQAAAAAALQAGSMAALSARSQPGAWAGEKGARVATAALGAAAMNAFQKGKDEGRERERERDEGKKKKGGSKGGRSRRNSGVEALGGALGGFLIDQLGKKRK